MNQQTVTAIRHHLGLSAEELAFILRVSSREVSAWESGLEAVPAVYASRLGRFDRQGLGIFATH